MQNVLLHWLADGDETAYSSLSFEFGVPLDLPAFALLLALATALAAWYWWAHLVAVDRRRLLTLLRVSALALVLFLLCDPLLVARRSEPGEQFVLLLFDDSRSMQVPGADGLTRGQRLRRAYAASDLEEKLRQSHQVVLFRFGERLERLRHPDELHFAQRKTDLVGAVEAAQRKMAGTALAAVVLFSDGIQQTPHAPAATLPDQVPVFAVGTDADTLRRSLELAKLSVSRTPYDRSPVALTAHIRTEALAGEEVALEVLENSRPVAATSFAVATPRDEHILQLEFVPRREGWLHYRARVRLSGSEAERRARDPVAADNIEDFLVDNRNRTYRILYFGGRPSWENKFLRRALDLDPQLALSSLIRVSGAERKFVFQGRSTSLSNPLFEGFDDALNTPRYDEAVFLRLGLQQTELATGYPLEASDLFPYHLLIWGDIERAFFSQGHMELTRDFVARRGGSFLLTGGPRSLAEGGYARTPIETMLPVALGRADEDGAHLRAPFHPRPTIEGLLEGVWALDPDPRRNEAIWASLPPLYGINRLATTRIGATVLAQVAAPGSLEGQPLFAWQRYGEGTSAVLATGATWPLHMLAQDEDASYQLFWRQLVRGLLKDVPDPVLLRTGAEDLHLGDVRQLQFLVRDSLFIRREGLVARLDLTDADGGRRPLPVEESIEEAGLYAAEFNPQQAGLHLLHLTARNPSGATVGTLEQAVLVHPDDRELRHSHYKPALLRKIAARSGGRFVPLAELDELAAQIPRTDSQHPRQDRFHLWHLSPFYALLVALFAVEWYLRRKQGQP